MASVMCSISIRMYNRECTGKKVLVHTSALVAVLVFVLMWINLFVLTND